MSWISIQPRDPIIARDGRPFSASQRRMHSVDWPYPSVLAGSLRTLAAKTAELQFTAAVSKQLREIEVAGPLASMDGTLYFPAPADIAIRDEKGGRDWFAARPRATAGGCNFPSDGLLPVVLRREVDDFKPARVPALWSRDKMGSWLAEEKFEIPPSPNALKPGCGFLNAPDRDERTHVMIDAESGAAKDRYLFQTSGLDFAEGLTMAARAENAGKDLQPLLDRLDAVHPFGGERRLAQWTSGSGSAWEVSQRVADALKGAQHVRLVLATPAIFAGGWKPGWVRNDLTCSLLNGAVEMRLVGVTIQRWRPISGWSLEASDGVKPGPKAVKRIVPAGGVYFFRVERGDASELARQCWLRPVSDDPQDCRDGFGLALWGRWSEI